MRYQQIDRLHTALAMALSVVFTVVMLVALAVTMRAALLWVGAL